jgi:hypothetical protein
LQTSLSHLPVHKQAQLKEVTDIIVKSVDPEKVILFGSHATGRWVEHRYAESGISDFAGVHRAVTVVVCFHQQLKLSLKREMLSVVYLEASWQALRVSSSVLYRHHTGVEAIA